MTDRNVQYPNRYMLVPVDGSDELVDLIPAPGEIYELATPLNKGTWLKDSTASMLGLTSADPTVDEALRALAGRIQIATGSYTGTGTYGQSAPNSLNFGFAPDVVFVFTNNYAPVIVADYNVTFSDSYVCFLRGVQSVRVLDAWQSSGGGLSPSLGSMPYTMSETGISWYNSGRDIENFGPKGQMNTSGTVYHYLAIGRGQAG